MYKNSERHKLTNAEAYTYDMLCNDLILFKERFPQIPIFSIGKSLQGREIYAFKVGTGTNRSFICGAHHGMEWLTALICMRLGEDFAANPPMCSIYIVPMVNPDGVEIASLGYCWQANARGVDLNHNYDALWEISRSTEERLGINSPCASKFGGDFPESEPESRAVADFTRQNSFDAVFALHSQGKVIYYDFCGVVPPGSEDILNKIEGACGYVREKPVGTALYGGYKDWFIKKYKKPGFTIEVGLGENPLPLSMFDEIYNEVKRMFEVVFYSPQAPEGL